MMVAFISIFCTTYLDITFKGNVSNQRENIVNPLSNEQSRLGTPDEHELVARNQKVNEKYKPLLSVSNFVQAARNNVLLPVPALLFAINNYLKFIMQVTVPSMASVFNNEYALKSQYDTSIYLQNLILYGYGAIFKFLGILGTVVIKGPESFDILQGHSKATMFLFIIMMGEELVGLMGEQLAKPATSCVTTENGVSFLEQVK
ncbi:hypothetical protein L2E82_30781 [Cichorium intybus]|uniref:Uncharacterized protein n=1 Tax=Cichorium intybus TaxID=13427 RepID=A0ACB9D1M2_CICIN|nr:hypothetical protein L2E82_30781 [Cichorium intybus]